jgi:hypothetical protein
MAAKSSTTADFIDIRGLIESEPFQIYKMNLKKQENNSGCLEICVEPGC